MDIKHFIEQVLSFIRTKDAKNQVEKELYQHLQHSKKAWMTKGYTDAEAEQKAVQQMGSANTLGMSMRKLHQPKMDWLLFSLVCLLLLFSFLPLFALNDPTYKFLQNDLFLVKNVLSTIVAITLIIAMTYIDVRLFARFSYYFYSFCILLLIAFVWFSNYTMNGEAMLAIGPIHLTVWYVLPLLCIAWAGLFSKTRTKLWHALILSFIPLFLILMIANLSVLLISIVMTFVMVLFGNFTRKEKTVWLFLSVGTILTGILLIVIGLGNKLLMPYQFDRLLGFLNPEKFAETSGYMYVLLNDVMQHAKWFGSTSSITIPSAHTDFPFSLIMQSYGIFVAVLIAFVLLVTFVRMIWTAVTKQQSFAKLLIIGASTLYATQVLYTLAMTAGLLPIFSIPLPFISYGFMPTIFNAFLFGLVLSLYRRKSFIFRVEI